MKSDFVLQPKIPTAKPDLSFTRASARMLQRKCTCGRTVVAISGRMLMISIVLLRLGKLIEKMMHLMGRGIE